MIARRVTRAACELGGGVEVAFPILEIGAGEGPHVVLLCGVHGDEMDTLAAVWRLLGLVGREPPRGRCTIVPATNALAMLERRRVASHDGHDLNRAFGQAPRGSPARGLADVVRGLTQGADIVLCLHQYETPAPTQAVFWALGDARVRQREWDCVRALDPPLVFWADPVRYPVYSQYVGTIESTLCAEGCPALLIETSSRLAEDELASLALAQGILRMWRWLADERPPPAPPFSGTILGGRRHLRHERHGLYISGGRAMPAPVAEGDRIGTVVEMPGLETVDVRSPIEGLLIQERASGYARAGEYLAVVGEIVEPRVFVEHTGLELR